jgi:hypothetical protein
MARVFALDEEHCDQHLRSALQNSLRVYDECVALPQANKSSESGSFKNVVMNLNGQECNLNPDIFSPNWFSGVSGVVIQTKEAEEIINDPVRRAKAVKDLANAIPSELSKVDESVGPELECTPDDRDLKPWNCGFDSPGCCVGLYSTIQSRNTDPNNMGTARPHKVYFLICKAGGGIAAQTFHSRLSASLKKGRTLEEALAEGNVPGAQALRRVGTAAQRNRGRILCLAAEALGLHVIDTLNDTACPMEHAYRVAVCSINVTTNSIRKTNPHSPISTFQYFSGCVDAQSSQGVLSCSNVAEGFLLFTDQNGEYKINVKNEAFNSVPFSSVRIKSNRDVVMEAAEKMKTSKDKNEPNLARHADSEWIKKRFMWKSRDFGLDVEPPCLLGTYKSETFSSVWSRELGLSNCRAVRLIPEVVCIAATEPAKLRAASRHVHGREAKQNAIRR